MDIKTTFMAAELQPHEEIYVTQPQGFTIPGKEHLALRLRKALHGLKQTPEAWYRRIDSFFYRSRVPKGQWRLQPLHSIGGKQNSHLSALRR